MAAQKTIGTILAKLTSPSFNVMNLTSIGEIGVESNEIDTTDLESSGGFKEYIAGFKDAGELPLKGIIKNDDNVAKMYALAKAQTVEHWSITAPNGSLWTFYGFVKMFKEGEVTVEGVRTYVATIRVSGEPNYDPTTGISV